MDVVLPNGAPATVVRPSTVPKGRRRVLYEAAGPGARFAEYDRDHDVVTHLPARLDRLAYLT